MGPMGASLVLRGRLDFAILCRRRLFVRCGGSLRCEKGSERGLVKAEARGESGLLGCS